MSAPRDQPDWVSPTLDYGTESESGATPIVAGVETLMDIVAGTGYLEYFTFQCDAAASSHLDNLRIYADGVLVVNTTPNLLNTWAYTAVTPKFQEIAYLADGLCRFGVTLRVHFKTELRVTVTAIALAGAHNTYSHIFANLIR